MILDSKLEFSDAQALASLASVATNGTNVIDLGPAGKDAFGNSEKQSAVDLSWFVNINTAMVGAGVKLYCDLVTGDAVSSGAISSAVAIARITFPAASAAGKKQGQKISYRKLGRYLGVQYTADATLTSAKVDSGLIFGGNDSEIADKFQG